MKRLLSAVATTVCLTTATLATPAASAAAPSAAVSSPVAVSTPQIPVPVPGAAPKAPRITKKVARKIGCTKLYNTAWGIGPKNKGVWCWVNHKRKGTQAYAVVRYKKPKKAAKFWRTSAGTSGYLARKGKVFILPNGYDGIRDQFSRKWARHAAKRTNGRVIRF